MSFNRVIGHAEIIENLRKMVESNKMPHAVLLTERAGYGALTLALATIEELFGGDAKVQKLVHPDLHFTFPINISTKFGSDKRGEVELFYPAWRELVQSNPYFSEQQLYRAFGIENRLGTISVAEANSIMKKLSLSAYEGGAKVMLIMFPERMNQEAANKLLKSLEEPQPGTYYFLVSHNPGKIISTILSRCRIIEVPPIEFNLLSEHLQHKLGVSKEEGDFWAKCSGGSLGKALELIERDNEQSSSYSMFISMLQMGVAKNLSGLIDIWEQISSYGKEAQREVCIEGGETLRKLYMISLGMDEISYASVKERETLTDLSKKIKTDFYQKGYGYLNNAIECIERNVNPKFIFCDLCNRIYHNI